MTLIELYNTNKTTAKFTVLLQQLTGLIPNDRHIFVQFSEALFPRGAYSKQFKTELLYRSENLINLVPAQEFPHWE